MPSSFRVALPPERRSSMGWLVSTLRSPKQRHRNRHETNARWSCPLRWAEWTNSPVELATTTGWRCRRSSESSAIPRRRRRSSYRSRCLRLCWAREIKAIALFSCAIVGSRWWSCKKPTGIKLVREKLVLKRREGILKRVEVRQSRPVKDKSILGGQ